MYFSDTAVLFLSHGVITAFAFRVGRGSVQPIDSISSVSSIEYRHTAYVDQRVRQNAYTFLNHESWHQRNVIPTTSDASLGPSNITSESIAEDEAFVLPASSPLDTSTNTTSSGSDYRLTDIPELLQSSTTPKSDDESDASWNNQTDATCMAALKSLNGIASNPSGLAACYNVRSFSNISGTFKADLRLFQISAPTETWTHLESSSESLDVTYATAEIMESKGLQKRDTMTYSLRSVQEIQPKSMRLRRANEAHPRMLEGLTFLGMVNGKFSMETVDDTTMRSILTPNVTFSGSSQGVRMSTQLSINDASFVNGLFTVPDTTTTTSKVPASVGEKVDFRSPGTNLAVFPVGLIITSIWALLLMMIMGYSTINKIQAREAYRRRIRSRMSGGLGKPQPNWNMATSGQQVRFS